MADKRALAMVKYCNAVKLSLNCLQFLSLSFDVFVKFLNCSSNYIKMIKYKVCEIIVICLCVEESTTIFYRCLANNLRNRDELE